MPEAQAPEGVSDAALAPDEGIAVPRISATEQGVTGLRTSNGRILAEHQAAFRYPQFISTVREMRNNPTIGAAMNVWRMAMARVKWDVQPPPGASKTAIARASAVRSMMHDMDHSWQQFIEETISYLEYGFKPFEIIARRRLRRFGSKYNDGIKGIKRLAPRNPETIKAWRFNPSGADLLYLEQSLEYTENSADFTSKKDPKTGNLILDVNKLLLFSASPTNGNPEGNSIFKNIYLAHKQLTMLQEKELLGVAKDVDSPLVIGVPPEYLTDDSSPAKQVARSAFNRIIDLYNAGQFKGSTVPQQIDPETRQPLFTYQFLENKSVPRFDVEQIISRLQSDILQALCVDMLKMGANGTGSFSLAESKTNILTLALLHRLSEIRTTLNQQLMRWIYEQNGWDMTEMAEFVHDDVERVDMDTFGKFVQRTFSTNAVEADREIMNVVREMFGVKPKPDDEEVDVDELPANMATMGSRSGDGMSSPTGNGTSTDPFGGEDTSTSNSENT